MRGSPGSARVRRRSLLTAGVAISAAAACGRTEERPAPLPSPPATPPPAETFLLREVRVFDGERLTDADAVRVRSGETSSRSTTRRWPP